MPSVGIWPAGPEHHAQPFFGDETFMRIAETDLRYELGGKLFEGLLVAPAGKLSLPTVLIFPDWAGRSANQESVARRLAGKGYAAVCVDLHGQGRAEGRPVGKRVGR